MNHCHDCNSDYSVPGTCNCFAPGGSRHHAATAQPVFVPQFVPSYPLVPTTAPAPSWWPSPYFWCGHTSVGATTATVPAVTTVAFS